MLAPAFLLAIAPARAADPEAEPLAVRAQVAPGVHYVGEGVAIQVGVVAGGTRPEVVAPAISGAEVWLEATGFRPISTGGIGDVVVERNLFLDRFRLVARRAGVLAIPPFRARQGAREGASRPLRVAIEAPPIAGRPAGFLGGVGPFEVGATARPTTLRVGQEVEFRVRIDGPGALGADRAPALDRLERLPLGLRIEPMPGDVTHDPPSRTFRFRLRPTRPGAATLPPLPIASFDPRSLRYETKVTPGVPIRVVAVPRYEPGTLDYGPPPARPGGSWAGPVAVGIGGALGLIASACAWARARAARRGDPILLARRLARTLGASDAPEATARAIHDGLTEYLARALDRPRGALTPAEARDGVERATGSAELARRAEGLVARCDRVRYGPTVAAAGDLADVAAAFFRDMGDVPRRGARPGVAGSDSG